MSPQRQTRQGPGRIAAAAIVLAATGALVYWGAKGLLGPPHEPAGGAVAGAGSPGDGAPPAEAGAPESPRLARPEFELAELTVTPAVDTLPDRDRLAAQVTAAACGDEAACAAVRTTLRDPSLTTIGVPDDGMASIKVRVPRSEKHLALRAAFAAAGVLAAETHGLVADGLLDRSEDAVTFAGHAITEPLGAPLVRDDRVAVLEKRGEGVVRLHSVGLSRWGEPEIEVAALPEGARQVGKRFVLAVATALVRQKSDGPVVLAGESDGLVGGRSAAESPGIAVPLVSVAPQPGDRCEFMARVEPPGGEGPMAALELVERVYGPVDLVANDDDAGKRRREALEHDLDEALDERPSGDAARGAVEVSLPFPIPGGGGNEILWVRVTGHSARTVSGTIADDPIAATDVARGDPVTRPRADVVAIRRTP